VIEDLGHPASGVDPYPGFRAWFPKSGSTTSASCWGSSGRTPTGPRWRRRYWTRQVRVLHSRTRH